MILRRLLFIVVCCGLSGGLAPLAGAEDWPQFRGPGRDAISRETGLLRKWPAGGPAVLWSVPMAQGYSAAAIVGGHVYFNDYDEDTHEWRVHCLKLNDGVEVWRFKGKRKIRPNHGITRTVPAVDGKHVFSLDPKCVLHCLDVRTGTEVWRKSLVKEYGTKIPPWYNGQCPLLEEDRIILATGGQALLVALDKDSGSEIWRTPNPEKRLMSHASVMPAVLGGVKQYLYCTFEGLLGVAADGGKLLWTFPYKFNVAVAPSPLAVDAERIFMTAGYDAGTVMIRVLRDGDGFRAEKVFDLPSSDWNSEVQTPIVHRDHLFAVGKKKRGLLTCLNLAGEVAWTSEGQAAFGLGGYLLADGMLFILEGKTGTLRLIEANTTEYRELDSAQVLSGHDVWGPPALSNGKLVLRDMNKMVCVQVGDTAVTRPSE